MNGSSISDFDNPDYSNYVRWKSNGKVIEISNSGRLLALQKKDGNVLILHIEKKFGPDNAFIVDQQGDEVKKISNYAKEHSAICYDDAYYVGEELTVIATSNSKRIACVIDEAGSFVRIYETR